jgi:hypothetical protein
MVKIPVSQKEETKHRLALIKKFFDKTKNP